MKLKYYLRGLGIGIIVTAIIMSFIKKPEELTDAEIKARAAMLGMVEKNVLADIQENSNLSKETVKEENKIETVPEIEDTETDLVKENMGELDSAEELSNTEKADEVTENLAVEKKEEVIDHKETEKQEEVIDHKETEKKEEVVDHKETEKKEEVVDHKETEKTEESANNKDVESVEKYIIITIEPGNGSETVCQKLLEAGLINSVKDYNKYLIQNGYDRSLRSGNHEIPVGATEKEMAQILCELD